MSTPLLRIVAFGLAAWAAGLIAARPSSAQVTTATVYVLVMDATGAVLPGADATLTNEQTAATLGVVTDAQGEAAFNFVPVGPYTLRVALSGFATHEQSGLALSAGQVLRLTLPIGVAGLSDTVKVTAGAPLINRANAQSQSVIGREQLQELPLATRDWTKTVELDTSMQSRNNGLVMNGLPPAALTLTVDGTNGSSDAERAAVAPQGGFSLINGVSTESIEEISVSNGIASAEFGGTMAGNVNIITRSGTNRFRGTLFDNHQRDEFDASNPFVANTPDKTYNQFGGSLGGPLVANRLFFFGAYEGVRSERMTVENGVVPTPEWRARTLAANPVYAPFFAMFPDPTAAYAPGARTANFVTTRPERRDDDDFNARLDWNLSSANRVTGRYTGGLPYLQDPRFLAENPRTSSGYRHSGSFAFTHTASSWVSETRLGINVTKVDRIDGLYDLGLPNVSVLGASLSSNELFQKRGTSVSADHVIALARGRHAVKVGVNLLHQAAGRANFATPNYTYSTEEDFFANVPSALLYTFGLDEFQLRGTQLGGFVQDDIRLGRSLVLNVGVRYDYFTVPDERDGRLFNRSEPWGTGALRPADRLYDADYNNISPRVGFAWTLDARSVVRGGAGVFINPHPLYGGPVDLVQNSADEQFSISLTRLDGLAYGFRFPMTAHDVESVLQGPSALWASRSIAGDFPNPYSTQWMLGYERELGQHYSVDISYTGNRGDNLNTVREINQPDRVTGIRPYPDFAVFGFYDASNSSRYQALQLGLRRRYANRFSFGTRYTYSTSHSYGGGDLLHEDRPQESFNLAAEYGPSSWDVRHRFAANVIYELPALTDSTAVRALTGGWQVAGIVTARSGEPITVMDGASSYRSSRPDYSGGAYVLDNWRDSAALQYLDPAAFPRVPLSTASGAQVRPGTLGWNALRGPSFFNLDLGLSRQFYPGRYRLQFRVDLFNALNTRNYGGLNSSVNNSNFGRFTSVSTRTMQVGARFSF